MKMCYFNVLLALSLFSLVASFAPAPNGALSSSKLSGTTSKNIFEDPGGWFANKMEVMSDSRQVTLYHILVRDAEVRASVESGLGKSIENPRGKLEELKASIMSSEPAEEGGDVTAARFEAFQEAAKEWGSDSTAEKGGFLGDWPRGKLFSSVDDAVFNAEACEVIGPVQSIYGTHLFWISKITEG